MPVLLMPLALLGLAALPALAGVYFLRNRFRRRAVSSLMLWADHQRPREGGARVQRLQTPLLFFLELFTLAMLVLAATGPRLLSDTGGSMLVVVLDDSFSMRARRDGTSARDRAIAALRDQLDAEPRGAARFITAGPQPQLVGDIVRDRAEADAVLDRWTAHAPAADLPRAIALAAELAGGGGRILVLSDHAPPDALATDKVQWWAFGQAARNIAIVSATRHASPSGAGQRLLIELANYSPRPARAQLTITADQPLHTQPVELEAGGTQRITLNLPADVPAITATLGDDALDSDNIAHLLPADDRRIGVAVNLADESLATMVGRALRATGRVEAGRGAAALVVAGSPRPTLGDAWQVVMHTPESAEAFIGPFVINHQHPLAEGLAMRDAIWAAGRIDLPGEPIVSTGAVPLITIETLNERARRVHVNLRVDLSSVQTTPNWPVLWWNIVRGRLDALPGPQRRAWLVGQTVTIDLAAAPERPATITRPTGERFDAEAIDRRVTIDADAPGVWQASSGDERYRFAVNAMSRAESNLARATSERFGRWIDDAVLRRQYVSVAWLPVLLALGALALHQALVHRAGRAEEAGA